MPQLFYFTTIFFVGVTISIVITRTWVVTPTEKIAELNNKIAEAYFTNRSTWFY